MDGDGSFHQDEVWGMGALPPAPPYLVNLKAAI